MIEIVLHEEAFEELLSAFIEKGICTSDTDTYAADQFTVNDVTFKRWKYVPTPEEIERNRQFAESPLGKACIGMFKRANDKFVKELTEQKSAAEFFAAEQWASREIGTTLKIRLPNDYTLIDGPLLRK